MFNYICDSGGFVEFSVLLKLSSLLESKKSELEAKTWLMSQADRRSVIVKDFNVAMAGV